MIESYTNTSLATARRCLREFELRYGRKLELDAEDREVLQVGQTWHRAHDAVQRGGDPYGTIDTHAPGDAWKEKLRRLFAAYGWYWKTQELDIVESERVFHVELLGRKFSGQIDGIVRIADGRCGVLERKTTSDGLEAESSYWDRLRLDVQVGLYALACGFKPDFILYDVVRKPTIRPKDISEKDAKRMRAELDKTGEAFYFEKFPASVIEPALAEGRESLALYGARLTADIGARPEFYFARREVVRTSDDYALLSSDLAEQVANIESASARDALHRNPDACNVFGRCDFFGLCSNNVRMQPGDPAPNGFRIREALHPELA
jgi:hypothetical protein